MMLHSMLSFIVMHFRAHLFFDSSMNVCLGMLNLKGTKKMLKRVPQFKEQLNSWSNAINWKHI